MKLFGNSLLISLGILLSDGASIVLAEAASQETMVMPATIQESPTFEFTQADNDQVEETTETNQPPTSEAEDSAEPPELTPAEITRQQKLIEADRLYLRGQISAAEQLYREAKNPFEVELLTEDKPEPFDDPTKLSPVGAVYWREFQGGQKRQLETAILVPLQFLVEQEPAFIPGHLHYAQALKDYEQEEAALGVLERASSLYPNHSELLKAKIAAQVEAQQWLEASLAARQFALFNLNHPQSEEFATLADEYLEQHQSQLRSELRGNAITNGILGVVGFVLTGNIGGPFSAIQTTRLMLMGESAVGKQIADEAKEQLPMLEDEEVLAYLQEVGNKLALVAGRDEFEYEFYVVMDDRLNAFALPGGKIFVNAGAILKTNSEAELAGLLAHELAHAVLSHGFQLVMRGNLIANIGQYIPYGGTATNLIVLDYSRDMERQADAIGSRILASSGYAADGLHNLMMTLAQQEQESSGPVFAWLSTHPDTNERLGNLETIIERNGYNRYTYEGVERHLAIQERVAQLLDEYEQSQEEEEN
ncbi:MAG: M48 family metalloprotease [Symploca sp. SIO2E6]|nr:M48 family metalloprotease [Symploca sp. SIO2E6]